MQRRDVGIAMLAVATGSVIESGRARAQIGGVPQAYAQTPAEKSVGVSPSLANLTYPPGDVRRYGAVGDGNADSTDAILNANRVAKVAKSKVHFPTGTYVYRPSESATPLIIAHAWEGESVESTIIVCDLSNYAGEILRLTGSCEIRNLFIKTDGESKRGIGLRIAAPDPTQFAGHVRLSRVTVTGFGTNIQADRSFQVTFDQVRSQYGAVGFYCEPGNTAPPPGNDAYVTTHLHLNCYYGFNRVNVFYRTDVTSINVTFIGGANEGSTSPFAADGSSYSAFFGRISNLHFIDWYCEAQHAPIVISAAGGAVTFDGLYLNGTGGIFLGSRAYARFINVRTTSGSDVIVGGDGSQRVSMESCTWPAAGNSINFASLVMLLTTVNGTYYESYLPSLRRGTGSPEGAVTAPVGTMYLRADGGSGTTLYVKERSESGDHGWVPK